MKWCMVWGTVTVTWCFLTAVLGQRITSPANQTIYGEVNALAASLTCYTADTDTAVVTWVFINHNTILFSGGTRHTTDARITFSQPADNPNVHNLQILRPQSSDQGTYKCEIANSSQAALFHLVLTDSSITPGVNLSNPPINHTGCCVQQGVTNACLPVCSPTSAPLGFNATSVCFQDLPKLIYCGSDGRNHEYCCGQSGVPGKCLMFCSNNRLQMAFLSLDHLECLSYLNQMVSCYEFGGAVLPTAPLSVSVLQMVNSGNYSVLLSWQPPQFNPSSVTGYIVKFKSDIDQTEMSSSHLPASAHQFSFKTQPNVKYSVFVVAVSLYGSSQPSNTVEIIMDNTSSDSFASNVFECCRQRGVSTACQESLCQPCVWATFNTADLLICYYDLPNIFSCLAGERNSSTCCKENNVPDVCVDMCSGSPPPFNLSLAVCVPRLSLIEACIQNGWDTQPSAPLNVTLQSVSANSATVTWVVANVTGLAVAQAYYVQVQRGSNSAPWVTVSQVVGTVLMLENLTETENYGVRIISKGLNSSSLPSATLHFRTYPVTNGGILETTVHNLTECCMDSGMPELCYNGCHYVPNMTMYYMDKLNTCMFHIGTVLTCAADGRDHSACCRSRGVQTACLPMCQLDAPGPLNPAFLVCIEDTAKIVMCFKEGLETSVRKPELVTVESVTTNTIAINWTSPITGPRPSQFYVSYSQVNVTGWAMEETLKTRFILQNLKPGTMYMIKVQSYLDANTLLSPPKFIEAQTNPPDTERPYINLPANTSRALWTNRTHCCTSSNISLSCQPLCMNQPSVGTQDCSLEELKILTCAADGRDHTLCCQQAGLPSPCLPLCGSHILSDYNVLMASCHAPAALQIITSCFLSYTGLVPEVPPSFTTTFNGSYVTLQWGQAIGCGDCTYDIHYWQADNTDLSSYTTIRNQSSPAFVGHHLLTVNRFYTFTVTAHNSKGSGPAAPWQNVFITELKPDISVAQKPRLEIHEQGTSISLVCDVFNYGMLQPSIRWRLRDTNLTAVGHELPLVNLTLLTEGNYSCSVTLTQSGAAAVTVVASSYVNIRFRPEFSYFRTDTVAPNIGAEAILACWFRGHPNISRPAAVWTKDGKSIPGNVRYSFTADSRLLTGITEFKLKVAGVVPEDYGMYQCNVSNQYGYAVAHTNLLDPSKMPAPVTGVPLQAKNMSACCERNGVLAFCLPICRLEVALDVVFSDPWSYAPCLLNFGQLLQCATDGADHSLCCSKRVVNAECLPFCRGEIPADGLSRLSRLQHCSNDATVILECAETGYDKIPTAPQQVNASFAGNKIVVSWLAPQRNSDKVTSFRIYYNFTGRPSYQVETVTRLVGSQHTLYDVNLNQVYQIWMMAVNDDHGMSQRSPVLEVSTYVVTMAPPDIRVKNVTGTSVTIEWGPLPTQSSMADSFVVYYKAAGSGSFQKKQTSELEVTLTNLKSFTEHVAYVTGLNLAGEGAASATVTFMTGLSTDSFGYSQYTEEGLSGGQTAGVVVGVILGVIFLAVVGFLVYRSRHGAKSKYGNFPPDGAVTFENPRYGIQQVCIGGSNVEETMQPAKDAGSFDYRQMDVHHRSNDGTPPYTDPGTLPVELGYVNLAATDDTDMTLSEKKLYD